MDVKKIALIGGMVLLAGVVFMQVRKMGTPPPAAPVAQISAPAPVVETVKTERVLVASDNIYMGSRLNAEMMEWAEWPAATLSESLVDQTNTPQAMEEFAGAVVRGEIAAGEPITRRKLVVAGDRSVMSALLKPGMRAVSVRISADTAASGFINPGDYVDVILTKRLTGQTGPNGEVLYSSVTVFENVEVLAIDQTYSQGPDGGAYVVGSIALFQLSQDDAEVLTVADSIGELSLTLRGLSNSRAASPPSRSTVERTEETRVATLKIYRNGQTEQVTLKDR